MQTRLKKTLFDFTTKQPSPSKNLNNHLLVIVILWFSGNLKSTLYLLIEFFIEITFCRIVLKLHEDHYEEENYPYPFYLRIHNKSLVLDFMPHNLRP